MDFGELEQTGADPGPDLTEQILRNNAHLRRVLPAILPAATDIDARDFVQLHPMSEGPAWEMIESQVTFHDDAGPAQFSVTVASVETSAILLPSREQCFDARCEKIPRPDGSTVVLHRDETGANLFATHHRADGSTVQVRNSTSLGIRLSTVPLPDRRSRPPLTDQQLTALVTDPALNLDL